MFPGGERAVGADAAFYFDHAGGTKIRPGEFFFAGPDEFYGTARGAGDACGFEGGVAGVFAAVGGAGVWNDDADGAIWKMKCAGQFVANTEGALRAGPDGEFVAAIFFGPFGESGARFERSMGDEGDGVGGVEAMRRGGERGIDGTLLGAIAVVWTLTKRSP